MTTERQEERQFVATPEYVKALNEICGPDGHIIPTQVAMESVWRRYPTPPGSSVERLARVYQLAQAQTLLDVHEKHKKYRQPK